MKKFHFNHDYFFLPHEPFSLVSKAEHVTEVGGLLGGQRSGWALAGAVTEVRIVWVGRRKAGADAVEFGGAVVESTRVVLKGVDVLRRRHGDEWSRKSVKGAKL